MIKRIKKIGNGNALFLDRAILELIGLEDGGEVQLTVNAGRITIVPVNPYPVSTERFESALERVVKE
jgi:antitoxin component of MazEF toxin-antitoxin module